MGLFNLFGRKARKSTAGREFKTSASARPAHDSGAFSYPDKRSRYDSDDGGVNTAIFLSDTPTTATEPAQSGGIFSGLGGLFGGGGATGDWGGGGDFSGGGGDGGGGGGGGEISCSLAADPMINRHRHWRLTI